jgi:NADPH:quinone reductase-like Zn-dependent oxidoreductase
MAGVVEEDTLGKLQKGQQVVSFVGGMARTYGGSYAEYVCLPFSNVVPVNTGLSWAELAAIPETYATAWSILHWSLQVKPGQSILVRGATSALGLAIIILAKQRGLVVIATTRSAEQLDMLQQTGADFAVTDDLKIADRIKQIKPQGVDNIAELTGCSTLADSMACACVGGTVCVAGFLGGMQPLQHFMPIMQIPSTVKLTSFGSAFVIGNPSFPYTAIPMQSIIDDIESGKIKNILAKTFAFEEIVQAHRLVESNTIKGKIVVTLP